MPGEIETIDIVETWLWGTLSGDGTLTGMIGADNIAGTLAPEALDPPYVAWLCQSEVDITGNAGQIISADALYEVKTVAQTSSWDDVRPVARRVHELLHRPGEVVTTDLGSLSCVRERIIQYPEVDGGVQYRHLGGIYRIRASLNG
jgi:hypothetical protein